MAKNGLLHFITVNFHTINIINHNTYTHSGIGKIWRHCCSLKGACRRMLKFCSTCFACTIPTNVVSKAGEGKDLMSCRCLALLCSRLFKSWLQNGTVTTFPWKRGPQLTILIFYFSAMSKTLTSLVEFPSKYSCHLSSI